MILAAGLTPAWQQTMVFEELRTGEVNRATEVHWCGSGKVLNVGLALHFLGAPSRTLSPLGGPAFVATEDEFARLAVPRRWVKTDAPTRVCTTILEKRTGRTTELVENARPLEQRDLDAFREAYRKEAATAELVVLSGSLPAGAPATFYRDLLAETPGRVVLDARGAELSAALERRPLLVKPNREELGLTVGHAIANDAELKDAMRNLNERGAEWVVVTQGSKDVWISSRTEIHRLTPPHVDVLNPIGCGDCLAAGFAVALSEGKDVVDAVRFGMAAAAENATQLLAGRLDRQRVEARLPQIGPGSRA